MERVPDKYNYVICGGEGFYPVAYNDLKMLSNVRYFSTCDVGFNTSLSRILLRINFKKEVNSIIKAPFRAYVYPRLFPFHFQTVGRTLCFLFFSCRYYIINSSYLEYLRKRYPNVRLVLYMQDLVSAFSIKHDIENYKRRFDLVISYDEGDCKKYGLIYHPTPYSRIDISNLSIQEESDVFFCGYAKSRYKKIFDVYYRCREERLKCKFFIIDLPQSEQIEGEGLIYDRKLSYIENLSYIMKSKCVLEIMQENATGYTPRLWESLMYDKHLLTDNSSVKKSIFYDPSGIHCLSDVGKISDWINIPTLYSPDVKAMMSPLNVLRLIEDYL